MPLRRLCSSSPGRRVEAPRRPRRSSSARHELWRMLAHRPRDARSRARAPHAPALAGVALPRALSAVPLVFLTSAMVGLLYPPCFVVVILRSFFLIIDLLDAHVGRGVSTMKHSRKGWWLPRLESESERVSESPVRRSWKDSETQSVIPMNSSVGCGYTRCATR